MKAKRKELTQIHKRIKKHKETIWEKKKHLTARCKMQNVEDILIIWGLIFSAPRDAEDCTQQLKTIVQKIEEAVN